MAVARATSPWYYHAGIQGIQVPLQQAASCQDGVRGGVAAERAFSGFVASRVSTRSMGRETMWLRNERFQRVVGGTVLERWAVGRSSGVQGLVLHGHKDPAVLRLIRQIRHERRFLLAADEAFLVYSAARARRRSAGSMAEVGVYEGGSARLICEAKGDTDLHLFDTFGGLPVVDDSQKRVHREHQYACSFASVQSYLGRFPRVFFHAGRFPDSAPAVGDTPFSFVHLDVDIYQSTRDCLEFFYPRMVPGGVILSHDYSLLSGVRKAVDEFLTDKPEGLIELPTSQCMVVKR